MPNFAGCTHMKESVDLADLPMSAMGERDREIKTLHIIAKTLNAGLDLEDMQAWMVQGVCLTLNAAAGVLILLDETDSQLAIKKTLGVGAKWVYQVSLLVNSGLAAGVISSGEPLRTEDVTQEPQFDPNLDWITDLPFGSFLCVPLIANGKTIGAIALMNKENGPFDDYDQELSAAIAITLANAIHNTRLIQQLKVANADLEANRWELLRSRNTLRALFDSTPTSIYIVDRKYTLIAINRARANIAKRHPNEVVGKTCYETLYQRSDPCPGCRVSETLLTGNQTQRIERRWETDGNLQELEINTYPIHNETGQVVQTFLFEEDVTEKRRLEATLAQSEKLAAVGQLAAGVAHEINNPLTAIIANAQLLQHRQSLDDEETQDMLDLIIRAGDRAAQVVRNLLDFARKEQYEFTPTDLNETIQRALDLAQHELVARSIRLTFTPAKDLPLILASRDHLQGVWLNLLLNAVDAIDDQQGEIRVSTYRQGNEIRVSMADNGQGIPPGRIPRIFEPFYTTKEPGRGTGLGLSVCHRIVKQHGGHMLVDSKIGMGTEFTVVLPLS
jgi:two-component system, NtrC family, sensor kinase